MTQLGTPRAVVFDMDGLLLDSERLARDCFVAASEAFGWPVDLGAYERCIGSTHEATERILVEAHGPDYPYPDIAGRWAELYQARLEQPVPVKPGARQLLEVLYQRGMPLAVATSTHRPTAELKLANADLARYFSVMVCGGETPRGKPHPEPYLEATRRLRCPANRAWAFEDSNNGVRAAHAAGMTVFQVPDLVLPDAGVRALGHRVLDSLVDVMPLLPVE